MPEITREEKLKIFSQLSPKLQETMFSDATVDAIDRMGKKYNLSDDKISILARVIGDIILGIVSITSLAQEINLKIISDAQAAMNLAQELYSELLAPVMAVPPSAPATPTPTPATPSAPVSPPTPTAASKPTPPAPALVSPSVPSFKFQVPNADKYREPATSAPEVIDLRKTPPPLISMPVTPAPIPPIPKIVTPPASKPAPKPLTFTKPIEPVRLTAPLLEAEPHLPPATPTPSAFAPVPSADQYREPMSPAAKPQYIIRPPGLQPTDLPKNVLDLRKDKGEF